MAESWTSGAAYDPYVGRWSQLVAQRMLAWLALPPHLRWVDVGSGTGMVTKTILAENDPTQITGVEPSAEYLAFARQQLRDPRVVFTLGDAQRLPLADDAGDVAISGLVLNFVPDPAQAVREMRRVVRPQGTVAAYVWDYAGQMQMMRYFWDAVAALQPDALAQDEAQRFPLCQPDRLRDLWQQAGLREIANMAIDVPTVFPDFAAFWTPFLGGQGAAPHYCMQLAEAARGELREYLRAALPTNADGSIHLIARAWAIRGRV